MRPTLRPGTHVLQRSAGELQVGLHPAAALVLPDVPHVRDSLRLLGASAPLEEYADRSTLDLLETHRQLIDDSALRPLLLGHDDAPTTAALARSLGEDAPAVHRARRRRRLETRTFGHEAGVRLRDAFGDLVRQAGLRAAGERAVTPPDCGALLGVGEPSRELLDPWARAAMPYLVVRLTEGCAVLGPFVLPGSTACLRCVDAHHTDADPAWPLLLRQYAAASSHDRADGVPEPVDPLLAALALSWAARDVTTYLEGGRPATWSTTVTLHPRLESIEIHEWLRHPACGCSWA